MSIQSEITRLSGNVSDALDAIEAKGVTIPTGANSDDLADLIGQISGGGGGTGGITQDQDGYLVLSPDGDLPTLITKTITQNGTYDAEDDNADGYSSVTVNVSGGGGGALKMGVIRPDAELVKSWTYDKYLVEDEGLSIGTYSTSSTTKKTLTGFESATVDFSNYNYYMLTRALTKPVYSSSDKGSGRFEYLSQSRLTEYVSIPTNTISVDGASATNTPMGSSSTFGLCPYWSSATDLVLGDTELYGPNFQFVNPTVANNTITPGNVSVRIRGNTTYYTQTYWNLTTDIRYQFIIELYRVPRNSQNLDGWGLQTQLLHDISCAQSASGTLT